MTDTTLNAVAAQARQMVAEATGFGEHELSIEVLDIPQSPDRSIWIRHTTCAVAVCLLITRSPHKTKITTEYPCHKDGHFVEEEYTKIEDAARTFGFTVRVIQDLQARIYEVI